MIRPSNYLLASTAGSAPICREEVKPPRVGVGGAYGLGLKLCMHR
jgi:hypothetical protein